MTSPLTWHWFPVVGFIIIHYYVVKLSKKLKKHAFYWCNFILKCNFILSYILFECSQQTLRIWVRQVAEILFQKLPVNRNNQESLASTVICFIPPPTIIVNHRRKWWEIINSANAPPHNGHDPRSAKDVTRCVPHQS